MYDRRNAYLERKMQEKDMARGRGRDMTDMRDMRGRDYRGRYDSRMDYGHHYPERDYRYDNRDYRDYGPSDYNSGLKYNREHTRNDMYEMYGTGMIQPIKYDREEGMYGKDHRMDYRRDYGMDYRRDYATESDYGHEEEEYKKHLHEWTEKLKKKDRIKVSKEQVLRQAKNMDIKFDDFTEDEFYAIYLMHISDYPEKSNDYNYYISMAKDWLKDDDVYYKGGDKVCSYLYATVLGK